MIESQIECDIKMCEQHLPYNPADLVTGLLRVRIARLECRVTFPSEGYMALRSYPGLLVVCGGVNTAMVSCLLLTGAAHDGNICGL